MEHRRCGPLKPVPDTRAGRRLSPSDPPLVYTVAEVAARLKVSPGTVRNMIDQGSSTPCASTSGASSSPSGPSTS